MSTLLFSAIIMMIFLSLFSKVFLNNLFYYGMYY